MNPKFQPTHGNPDMLALFNDFFSQAETIQLKGNSSNATGVFDGSDRKLGEISAIYGTFLPTYLYYGVITHTIHVWHI